MHRPSWITSPVSRYTISGSSQIPLPTSVPLSRNRALAPLLATVTPLMAGFVARSILIAAVVLFWNELPVNVEWLVCKRTPTLEELRIKLLVIV